jgi:hypothetical protein
MDSDPERAAKEIPPIRRSLTIRRILAHDPRGSRYQSLQAFFAI